MFSTAADRLLLATVCVILALATTASAQGTSNQAKPAVAPAPQTYAVIVSGIPGTPLYARRFADWTTRFHAYLTGPAGIPASHVATLTGDKDFNSPWVTGQATAQNIRQTLADLSQKVRDDDQFILVLIGHGQAGDSDPALLVPGPALTARTLAQDLNQIPARTQVVLNFAGAAGDMVKDLARAGRVNVAATGPGEEVEPVLAEFFLIGLETKAADGEAPVAADEPVPIPADGSPAPLRTGVKDGQVSMLEAYNWAARETAYWVGRQKMDDDESWIVEGSKSVEIFKKLCVGGADDPGAEALRQERRLGGRCSGAAAGGADRSTQPVVAGAAGAHGTSVAGGLWAGGGRIGPARKRL